MNRWWTWCVVVGLWIGNSARAGDTVLKTEHFDRDPAWDNSNNRVEASDPPTVKQDFGWRDGAIGGSIWQSTTPAWYGMKLDRPLTFHDQFSASGKISVAPSKGGSAAAYLGFFNHERQGWRPWSSMAMRIFRSDDKAYFYLDFMSGKWNAGAAEMDLSIPADNSQHTFQFDYDPDAKRGEWTDKNLHKWMVSNRQTSDDILAKAIKDEPDLDKPHLEARLRAALREGLVNYLPRHGKQFWTLKMEDETLKGAVSVQIDGGEVFRTFLREAIHDQPVSLDRFGIFNLQLYHDEITMHVTDLVVNGQKIDLSHDPGWEDRGNRTEFVERDFQRQNFGYSPDTSYAGGAKGEIGGQFYNVEPIDPHHGFYADEIGTLTLDDPIQFSGKVSFIEGSTDAGMFFGFFRAQDEKRELPPNPVNGHAPGWPQPNVLGIVVDGPAKIGWYFTPVCCAANEKLFRERTGHIFLPTRRHRTFDFAYDPKANNGIGRITVTLDGESPFTLDLTPEQRKAGATFDHFGLMSFRRGGKFSTLYFDDLTYTNSKDAPQTHHEQKITTVPYPENGRKY